MLTERARRWVMRRVGEQAETPAALACQLGVGWHTVMRAVRDYGQSLVDDPDRLDDVEALGVDEHVWSPAGPRRRTGFATGIVELTCGRSPRLLDVGPGRRGKVYADWIRQQDAAWRERVRVAALDPFRGYATALEAALPCRRRPGCWAFHVVRLGLQALDETRRRVQQDTLGHRGHKHDPLYQVRRLLRRGAETLSDRQRRRLETARQIGDPGWHVTIAGQAAQRRRAVYHAPNPKEGIRPAWAVLEALPSCPVPEVARLGRTLQSWRAEFLAYFATAGASHGPTEAMNLLIEKIRRVGHGYRNIRHYRLRLLLHCGAAWEAPRTAQIRTRQPRLVA